MFTALTARRNRTVVLLTARHAGDWHTALGTQLGKAGVRILEFPPTRLEPRHPHVEAVYRRAYRRFSPSTGAPDLPPPLPPESNRWTTLDVVMLGWLAAHAPTGGLPADRASLYEAILCREFENWNDNLRSHFGRKAPVKALRLAAAAISLLSPPPATVDAALRAVELTGHTSLAVGEVSEMLGRYLTDTAEGVLALRPDPLADHLITTTFSPDGFFLRCIDLLAGDGSGPHIDPRRVVQNLTRAADTDPAIARNLAAAVLRQAPRLWTDALAVVLTQGGPFVGPLEQLADRDDTSLPLEDLAHGIPPGHGALRTLALIAATRTRPPRPQAGDDEDVRFRAAAALNNLSVRQSGVGDRAAALASVSEAVAICRELAAANPAAFLPDLAMSLNNLSDRYAEVGDRAQATAVWEQAWSGLFPATRAELMSFRGQRQLRAGDTDRAVSDLRLAAQTVDSAQVADHPQALARARQRIRSMLADIDRSAVPVAEFPPWATTPIPDSLIDVANEWISAQTWAQRRQILTGPAANVDRSAVAALTALHCDNLTLQELAATLADLDIRGPELVFAELADVDAAMSLLREWIDTPTWNASQRFLAEHPQLASEPQITAALEQLGGDSVVRQHLAILRLVAHLPASDIYDAILDPTDARDLLLRAARSADAGLLTELWFAVPHLTEHPFAGPLTVALISALTGSETETGDTLNRIEETAATAVEQASAAERRDTRALLRILASNRDDRIRLLGPIIRAFADDTPASMGGIDA